MIKKLLFFFLAFISLLASAQVSILKEINNSGTLSSSPNNLFVFNNKIYFGADDSSGSNSPGNADLGRELWVTDGTDSGTMLVADLRTGSDSSSPGNFFELNGVMYFSANTGTGNVLFSSDGTGANTNTTGTDFIFNPVFLDGLIYSVNTTDGNQLYQFDGSTFTLVAGSAKDSAPGGEIIVFQNKIFYYGVNTDNEATVGRELYAYDPSTDTFSLIKDISQGASNSGISNFTILGNELYFEALGRLWKTDGTNAGTVAIADADRFSGTANLFAFDGKIFFEGDETEGGDNLIVYDPATNLATNLSAYTGTADHDPSDYVVYDGYLYYSGEEATSTDSHLYRTNGTVVELINNTIKDVDELVLLNNKIYFEGDNGTTGNELYVLDPTTLSVSKAFTNTFSVFPNPSKNTITVSHNITSKVTFNIFDVRGRSVLKGDLESKTIKHNLKKGIYLLHLSGENKTKTQKIIVN